MNRLGLTTAVLLGAALAAAGYWAGRQAAPPAGAAAPAAGERQVLYYRNPMGLADTSPVPKQDPMGMDYIPVYAGEAAADDGDAVRISPGRVQKLGVRSEPVARRALAQVVTATGRVEVDERRLVAVAPKFAGWVERLHVNVTGQPVRRGQPLFEVYSPELVSAQQEYQAAVRGRAELGRALPEARSGMDSIAAAALARLRNWDISEDQLRALAAGAEPRRTLTYRAPADGVVLAKPALQGMRFAPGETLFQVADLSRVWVLADVAEQDIGRVRAGARAQLRLEVYPGRRFDGTVSYVYPTLDARTRTVPVRLELANGEGLLKPAMYAQVELPAGGEAEALAVPLSAVIDSGRRQVALVDAGDGRFEPRQLRLGRRDDHYVEVLEGLQEGEQVVVAGNFLIDAESNLKAALSGLAAQEPPAAVAHRAEGRLEGVDAAGVATIAHGPVPSLKWPAMTMEFIPANPALLSGIAPGAAIEFEFVERGPGEWVVTRVTGKGN